jgi:hypothetical protein
MPLTLQNLNGTVSFKLINKPVDIINASAPTVAVAEWFWLADSVVAIPGNIFEKHIHTLERFFCRFLANTDILPMLFRRRSA